MHPIEPGLRSYGLAGPLFCPLRSPKLRRIRPLQEQGIYGNVWVPGKHNIDDLPDAPRALSDVDFEQLVRTNIAWMLAVAKRILRDSALSEDAVQMAFAKIHQHLDGFEGRSRLKTWMHRIVVNEALMILRKSKRKNEQPIDPLLPEFDYKGCRVDDPLGVPDTSEDQVQRQQMHDIVRKKIDDLPDAYRIVLILRDIEELSTREVAEVLELNEANVKVRLHRARAALKALLEPMMRGGAL